MLQYIQRRTGRRLSAFLCALANINSKRAPSPSAASRLIAEFLAEFARTHEIYIRSHVDMTNNNDITQGSCLQTRDDAHYAPIDVGW